MTTNSKHLLRCLFSCPLWVTVSGRSHNLNAHKCKYIRCYQSSVKSPRHFLKWTRRLVIILPNSNPPQQLAINPLSSETSIYNAICNCLLNFMDSELRPCFMTTDSPLWFSRDLVKSYLEMQHICSSHAGFLRNYSHRSGLSLPGWSGMLGAGLPRKRGAHSW